MQQPDSSLSQILKRCLAGHPFKAAEQQQLETWLLEDQLRAKAFGVTRENVGQIIQTRSHLLHAIYPAFNQCQVALKIQTCLLEPLWNLWLPLAMQLAERRQALDQPLIQGILGGQGTGKTTLGVILTLILSHLGYRALSFSLDDLYKTYAERLHLQAQDPRLVWRGPPGTHDVELGLKVLDQLRHSGPQQPIAVPQFDKSAWGGAGDRTAPQVVTEIDIVLFEGWFVGVRPIDPASFNNAPPPILTAADQAFAQDMNTKLQEYVPLWQRLDCLLILYLPDYRLSKQWRRQAEHQLIAAGRSGMSDREIDQFVEYFWRSLHPDLFIKPLTQADWVDLVVEIDADHLPGAVYKPSDRTAKSSRRIYPG